MAFEECLCQAEGSDDIILTLGGAWPLRARSCHRHVCKLPKLLLVRHASVLLPCTCSVFVNQHVSKKCTAVPGPFAYASDAT